MRKLFSRRISLVAVLTAGALFFAVVTSNVAAESSASSGKFPVLSSGSVPVAHPQQGKAVPWVVYLIAVFCARNHTICQHIGTSVGGITYQYSYHRQHGHWFTFPHRHPGRGWWGWSWDSIHHPHR